MQATTFIIVIVIVIVIVFSGKAIGEVNYKVQFNKLSKHISDKSYVALDEQSHGAGNVFDFKAHFVQYMHQKNNFDVFIIESGLFGFEL
jgi:erythromycin esterase-like protein